MIKKNLWLVTALIFLSSCATQLKYHMNNHKYLTPEAKGEFLKGDISLAYAQTQKVVVAEAFDTLVFNLPAATNTSSSITRGSVIDFPINLGLFKKLDLYNQDSKFGLKYQFIGKAENELTADEYKAAIALGYGYDHQTNASQAYTYNNSSRTYSTDMKVKSYELSLLIGYRFSETKLVYANILRDNYKYNGTLTSNQFNSINVSGKSYNQGLELGLAVTENSKKHPMIMRLEFGVIDSKLDNRNSSTVGTGSADFGWSW